MKTENAYCFSIFFEENYYCLFIALALKIHVIKCSNITFYCTHYLAFYKAFHKKKFPVLFYRIGNTLDEIFFFTSGRFLSSLMITLLFVMEIRWQYYF